MGSLLSAVRMSRPWTRPQWDVTVTVRQGDTPDRGQIYATCPETPAIEHRCMVPPTAPGTVTWWPTTAATPSMSLSSS